MVDRYLTAGETIEKDGLRWQVIRTVPGKNAWTAELRSEDGQATTVSMPPAYTPGAAI